MFRDRNAPLHGGLSSYALKTVAMQLRREDPHSTWEKKDEAAFFLKASDSCRQN